MTETIKTDILVIGAGSGGLSVAAGASQMGADTVLIERGKMGGDCLNYGCVPSKSMLAAARLAENVRRGPAFGVNTKEVDIDFARVHDHIHEVIASIAPNDSQERFEGFGVKVIRDSARFTGPREVQAGDAVIRARRIVIATGSAPLVPPIPGLEQAPFLTNETIFDNRDRPEHLIVIGGGPIGMELAQAHRRLGSQVTVLELGKALGKDDPELAAVVLERLREEGVVIQEGIKIEEVAGRAAGVAVTVSQDGEKKVIEGSHLLVATGRKANVEDLNLEAAGIEYTPKGIQVDERLRTTNRKVFAIGDVAGGFQFTHIASYHAGIVIRNALFRLPSKVDYRAVPWVTYTDPELAHTGLSEAQAREKHSDIQVLRWEFEENDRAHAERATTGLAKVVTRGGKILGATMVGSHAGELLQPWCLAISQKLKVGAMANLIVPYPTLGEVNKRAAGSYYTPKLFSDTTRRVVRFLRIFG